MAKHQKQKPKLPDSAPDWAIVMFDSLHASLADVEAKVDENRLRLESSEKTVTSLADTVEHHSDLLGLLLKRIKSLEAKNVQLENYSRRDNILFHNVPENETDSSDQYEACVAYIHRLLKDIGLRDPETLPIVACHRLGRRNTRMRKPRPIIVRFLSRRDRDTVFAKRSACKNEVKMSADFAAPTQARRRQLIPILVKAKKSLVYNNKVRLVDDRLIIDGTTYTVDNLAELPKELSLEDQSTQTQGSTTIFYSRFSPLSNFHPSSFVVKDTKFHSTEQYYQYNKAQFCGDQSVASDILFEDDPAVIHQHGKRVRDKDGKWNAASNEIMKTGLLCKFTQNPDLAHFLLDTGDTVLAESSKFDTFWGTGVSIDDPKAFCKDQWSGQNRLGKILMEVRDLIRGGKAVPSPMEQTSSF